MKTLRPYVMLACFASAVASTPAVAVDSSTEVRYDDGNISITAEQAALPELLDTIAFEADFEIVWSTYLDGLEPRSVATEGDLATVLKDILDGIDYALEYRLDESDTTRPSIAKLVILGTEGVQPIEAQSEEVEALLDEPIPTVGDMLNQRARQSARRGAPRRAATTRTRDDAALRRGDRRSPARAETPQPPPVEEATIVYDEQIRRSLAITTQRAQENLQSLVDALEEAEASVILD